MDVLIVAEIGINHNGSINTAKKLIDVASSAGCHYVKFQKRTIGEVYTEEELDKYRESPWGMTNRDQKYGLELKTEEYQEIDCYCKDKGIGWFASPWDDKSVDFLMRFSPDYIKVASAMVTNTNLLRKIKQSITGSNTKVVVGSGMATKEELDTCLQIIGDQTAYILSCTSSYPTPVEDMNMKKITTLKKLYGDKFKVGFSNHSSGIQFIYAAVVLGAEMIEFHVTLDRSMYGSDQAASIEPSGVFKTCNYIKDYFRSLGTGALECLRSEVPIRAKLRI